MGLFDGNFSFTDPSTMAWLGVASALGQAAMPSRLPVPTGAVLGQAAGGAMAGAQAFKNQLEQQQAITANIGTQSTLANINFMRQLSGLPAITMSDLQSGKVTDLYGMGSAMNGAATPSPPSPTPAPDTSSIGANAPAAMRPTAAPKEVSGNIRNGSDWEIANNNFAGMRQPGVPAAGGPMTNPGGWQRFATPADGIAGISHQLDRYASGATTGKPLTTLRQIVSTWAPASDGNATGNLVSRAANVTGFDPDQQLDMNDPMTKAKVVEAMIRGEQGGRLPSTVTPDLISSVVANPRAPTLALGTEASAPALTNQPPGNQLAQATTGTMSDAAPPAAAAATQTPMSREALAQALRSAMLSRMFTGATSPATNALMGAYLNWNNPEIRNLNLLEARKAAGLPNSFDQRAGGAGWVFDPATNKMVLAAQTPRVPEGTQLEMGPNGQIMASEVPNAMDLITKEATAKAAGPATFEPQEFHGPYGNEFLGTRRQLATGGPDAAAAAGAPVFAPSVPGTNMGIGVPGMAPPNTAAPGAAPAATGGPGVSAPQQRVEAAAPTFPVTTPAGPKDISQVTLGDMFPSGQGIPAPPKPPSGMGYGEATTQQKEIQKDDAERLEGYNKELSENQKIYQDLAHLRDMFAAGLNTGKLQESSETWTNIAHQLGADNMIPQGFDPTQAAEVKKVSTDLVFAAVKKLAGQVKVAEIQGYKEASPSTGLPLETNYNIMNDLLAASKWQDARANLANQYVTATGGAPLGAFDTRFNQMAPLVDVTASYAARLRQAGVKLPGALPAGVPEGAIRAGTYKGNPVFKVPQADGSFKMQVLQ